MTERQARNAAIIVLQRFNGADIPVPIDTHHQAVTFIADAIRAAVAEEREACAAIAEARCAAWIKEGDGESQTASQIFYGMADAGRMITMSIRARGTP